MVLSVFILSLYIALYKLTEEIGLSSLDVVSGLEVLQLKLKLDI